MARIIEGKKWAQTIREELKQEISKYTDKNVDRPGLAVIQVGEDPGSVIYLRNKRLACEAIGVLFIEYRLPEQVELEELAELIHTLNADERVDGIICQLPLPKHLDEHVVTQIIDPAKDVDGFHPMNIGNMFLGFDSLLLPCTPAGIIELIHREDLDIAGKTCVVLGRSNIVGKPMASLLLSENGTVTIAHSKTKDLPALCRTADVLIAAIGKPEFIDASYIKPGAIVIDVGINRNDLGKVVGDVHFDSVEPLAGYISPVPGGVGPMTVTTLLANTVKAWKHRKRL